MKTYAEAGNLLAQPVRLSPVIHIRLHPSPFPALFSPILQSRFISQYLQLIKLAYEKNNPESSYPGAGIGLL
jgi:hypothetical protein